MQERRLAPRVAVNLPISLVIGDEEGEARMMDISEHGMFVKTNRALAAGAHVAVKFVLREGHELCTAEGAVKWSGDLGGGIDLTSVNDAFAKFVARLSVVADYPRSKKEMLDGLLYPPEVEIRS